MPVDSAANLIALLRQTRLLEPAQLDEVEQVLQAQYPDVRALAKALMEREWLTAYQVNQLLQGGKDLMLGQYVLLQRLNETLLGQVYKARHQHMKRLAVLTIVREKLLAQPGAVERFYQEIQAVSRLNHTSLAIAFDAGPVGRTHFFALEYVEGIDLDQLVHQSGPVSVPLAAHLVRQVALGLQHAHERGVLHHDLKPASLLVTRLGGRSDPTRDETPRPTTDPVGETQVKICNLGLTLLLPRPLGTGSSDDSLDGWYRAEGVMDFCPPEQQPGMPLTDIRSNLYSLGCILYYLLAGRVPFPGPNPAVKYQQHQSAEPDDLQSLRWEVPPEVCAIVRRLMAKRPGDRFQTPAELAAALAPWCTDAAPAPSPARQQAASPPGVAGLLRRPWLLWGAASLILVLGTWLLVNAVVSSGSGSNTVPEDVDREGPSPLVFVKGNTREETVLATLKANRLPTLEGDWYYAGPFDNKDHKGYETVYPPETGVDLKDTYPGKDGQKVEWKKFDKFRLGQVVNLKLFKHNDNVCVYLYHEFEAAEPVVLPVSFGNDDTLQVWLNGMLVVGQNEYRGCRPDQARPDLKIKAGKNQLLVKVCNGTGDFAVYVSPLWPESLRKPYGSRLDRLFPPK